MCTLVGPLGWGFSLGPTTLTGKTKLVTETATKENNTDVDEAPESQPGTCMTASSESRKEAADTTRAALNTAKTRMKIGFWNVQTMYDTGRLAQVTSEMRRYNLHWELANADGLGLAVSGRTRVRPPFTQDDMTTNTEKE
ncbi:hypothetical protein DPMN_170139 [Dreissena polymorpha]|uniref:Uncharacterized protein n=1 Tax=Dreissena polymorpha TaxID=45954 RepID=A0A9D4IBA1_DREPO|nr:hypothetical protein DPMN_170139 [Dreissena polymorpha]